MTFYNISYHFCVKSYRSHFCHKGTTVILYHKGASVKYKAIEAVLTDKGIAVFFCRKDTTVILNRKSSISVSKMDFFKN